MRSTKLVLAAIAIVSLAGCQPPEQIQTYEVAKETYGGTSRSVEGSQQSTASAPSKPGRILVTLIEKAGRVWFIKLIGEETEVSERADDFRKLVESIEFVG